MLDSRIKDSVANDLGCARLLHSKLVSLYVANSQNGVTLLHVLSVLVHYDRNFGTSITNH